MTTMSIEEIENQIKRLFGNDDIAMPILLVTPSNIVKTRISIDPRRKCSIKRK